VTGRQRKQIQVFDKTPSCGGLNFRTHSIGDSPDDIQILRFFNGAREVNKGFFAFTQNNDVQFRKSFQGLLRTE